MIITACTLLLLFACVNFIWKFSSFYSKTEKLLQFLWDMLAILYNVSLQYIKSTIKPWDSYSLVFKDHNTIFKKFVLQVDDEWFFYMLLATFIINVYLL